MGRNPSYDMDEVMRNSISLFWSRGYFPVSVQDIVEATGLNRFALYEKFGGKEELFVATMDYYLAVNCRQGAFKALLQDDANLSTISAMVTAMRTAQADPSLPGGCLIINTATELAHRNADVEQRVLEFLDTTREAVGNALSNAANAGEIDQQRSVDSRTDYVAAMVHAVLITARLSRPSADELAAILEREVEGWRVKRALN